MLQKLKNGLKPKGFWGYFGVALFLLLASAIGYQLAYEPLVILTAADAANVSGFIQELILRLMILQQQCLMS